MHRTSCAIPNVFFFTPVAQDGGRGFFSRSFDLQFLAGPGPDPDGCLRDTRFRSRRGEVRGLHCRTGSGEATLVRCADGAVHEVVVDARPDSPTFGRWQAFRLDDRHRSSLYVPRGVLHGYQALTGVADVCHRTNDDERPASSLAVRHDDPDLAIPWPLEVTGRDAHAAAARWRDAVPLLLRTAGHFTV